MDVMPSDTYSSTISLGCFRLFFVVTCRTPIFFPCSLNLFIHLMTVSYVPCPPSRFLCLSWISFGPSRLVVMSIFCFMIHSKYSSVMEVRFVTSANLISFLCVLLILFASRYMNLNISSFSSVSPPWNSMVIFLEGDWNMKSRVFFAVSILMSNSLAAFALTAE